MEYICIILDVSESVVNNPSILAVESLIKKKIFSESKDEIALIFSSTDKTNNPKSFENISIVSGLQRPGWNLLNVLQTESNCWQYKKSDLLESIYIAAEHLVSKLKGRKSTGKKRIILFSNLDRETDLSQIDDLQNILIEEVIEFNIVIDDSVDKNSEVRSNNDKDLRYLCAQTRGCCFLIQEIVSDLNFFEPKSVRQQGWKVNLQVSNIFSLSIVGYVKVKQNKPGALKPLYGGDVDAEIVTKVNYHLDNGEQTPVDTYDLIKGFKYGKSIVPCTKEDIQEMKIEVEKSMKLIGFTEQENVPRTLFVGDGSMVFVVANENHSRAFTSLVYAMYGCQVFAIVRRVYNKASSPRLGVLMPRIKSDHVSLVFCEIAFGEDIRSFWFPNLFQKDDQTSNSKQVQAVDDFIDHMMLLEPSPDDKEIETYKPKNTYNPATQYFYQCVESRCLHPDKKLPDISPHLQAILKPPKENLDGLEKLIDNIKEQFPLKVKLESIKKKMAGDIFCADSTSTKIPKLEVYNKHFNLDDILDNKVVEVGAVDPVNDFIALLELGQVSTGVSNMESRIWQLINDSYKSTFYPKALLCLHELRKKCIEFSTSQLNLVTMFNEFMISMKSSLISLASKKDFWSLIVQDNINLISQKESAFSSHQLEAEKFLLDDLNIVPEVTSDDEINALFDYM